MGPDLFYQIERALQEQLEPHAYEIAETNRGDEVANERFTLWKNEKERYAVRLSWSSDHKIFLLEESTYMHSVQPESWKEIGQVEFEPGKVAQGYEYNTVQSVVNLILTHPPKPKKTFVSRAKLTNRLLTDLVLRYAGLMMFMQIFGQVDNFFMSYYLLFFQERMAEVMDLAVDKLYRQEVILMMVNVVVSLFLIFKAEILSRKLVKQEVELEFKLTVGGLINLILLTTSIFWLCYSLFFLADFAGYTIKYAGGLIEEERFNLERFDFLRNIVRIAIAIWFIVRTKKVSEFIERKMGMNKSEESL